jgi:hypothetical protein
MSTASQCPHCNLPRFSGAMGYVGPQCQCEFRRGLRDTPSPWIPTTFVPVELTERRVREIIREELAKMNKESE